MKERTMTEQKQPEALRLSEWLDHHGERTTHSDAADELRRQHAEIEALQADLAHKDDYAEQLGRELAKADSEAKELRAKMDELARQEHAAFVNEQGFIVERDDMQIFSGAKLYLAAGARPVREVPADDVLEALDLSPDQFRTEGGFINQGKLRAAIRDPEKYLPPEHWMRAQPAPAAQADASVQPSTCAWELTDEDEDIWSSSCGEQWSFTDGGPKENGVTYCHHCGKPVDVARAADKKEPI